MIALFKEERFQQMLKFGIKLAKQMLTVSYHTGPLKIGQYPPLITQLLAAHPLITKHTQLNNFLLSPAGSTRTFLLVTLRKMRKSKGPGDSQTLGKRRGIHVKYRLRLFD